jgi:hypothetical protein
MTVPVQDPAEGLVLAILFVGLVLMAAIKRLRRVRPGMLIGLPLGVAFGIRLLAIVGINATGLGSSLRGGDETTFLDLAQTLAAQPLGHGDFPHGPYQLQTVLFALQIKLGFLNVTAMRVTQVGIALLGFLFMLAAVHDLAGPRATRLAAWVLAFEPSSIFFNSEIHRESLLELAAGLVVFGGVWFWKRLDVRGILICAIGCLIAIETRNYAGWFMACGVVLLVLHASLRGMRNSPRSLTFVYAVIVAAFIAAPTVLAATGGKNLKALQVSQYANATGAGQQTAGGGANGNNLALEQVNYSSRGAIITSLPTKIRELLLEPYPWQLHDSSQMFGAIGTLYSYAILVLILRYAWLSRGTIFGRAGPLLYPLLFELVAYSVTVGNAGTGFRYRSHLVTLGICAMAVLHHHIQARVRDPQGGAAVRSQPEADPSAALAAVA